MKITTFVSILLLSGTLSAIAQKSTSWIDRENPVEKTSVNTVYAFVPKNCEPCINQLINLSHLKRNIPNVQIKIVTLKNDQGFKDYIAPFNLDARVLPDEDGKKITSMNVKTIPSYVYVDKENHIKGFYEANLPKEDVISFGKLLVEGKTLPSLEPKVVVGKKAPVFNVINTSASDKNWVIFHASGCPFSKGQLPALLSYASRHPKEKFFVVSFGDQEVIKGQFAKAPKNITVLPANNTINTDIASKYDVTATPTQVAISKDGVVRWRSEGYKKGESPFE